MSVLIKSEDKTSGEIYNGEWTLSQSMSGPYTLLFQYFQTQEFPWMWADNNALKIQFTINPSDVYTCTVEFPVLFGSSESYENAATGWQLELQNVLDQLAIDTSNAIVVTVTIVHDDPTGYFKFTFTGNFDEVQLSFADAASTCKTVFGKTENMISADGIFHLSMNYCTPYPKYLECFIEESGYVLYTSHNTTPNLLLSTQEDPITNQYINISGSTTTLNISMYRPNEPNHPVPFSYGWYMLFG